MQHFSGAPHLVICSHEVGRKLQVANARQADGELLLLGFDEELFFFGVCCRRDHVSDARDSARLSGDAAIGLTLIVLPDHHPADPVCIPRHARNLQHRAVQINLSTIQVNHYRIVRRNFVDVLAHWKFIELPPALNVDRLPRAGCRRSFSNRFEQGRQRRDVLQVDAAIGHCRMIGMVVIVHHARHHSLSFQVHEFRARTRERAHLA